MLLTDAQYAQDTRSRLSIVDLTKTKIYYNTPRNPTNGFWGVHMDFYQLSKIPRFFTVFKLIIVKGVWVIVEFHFVNGGAI